MFDFSVDWVFELENGTLFPNRTLRNKSKYSENFEIVKTTRKRYFFSVIIDLKLICIIYHAWALKFTSSDIEFGWI